MDVGHERMIAQLESERDRLREALYVAKLWLAQFGNQESDVWRHPKMTPMDVACEALIEIESVESEG